MPPHGRPPSALIIFCTLQPSQSGTSTSPWMAQAFNRLHALFSAYGFIYPPAFVGLLGLQNPLPNRLTQKTTQLPCWTVNLPSPRPPHGTFGDCVTQLSSRLPRNRCFHSRHSCHPSPPPQNKHFISGPYEFVSRTHPLAEISISHNNRGTPKTTPFLVLHHDKN